VRESYWCGSRVLLKIYSEEESQRRISWMHQSFGNVIDLDGESLGVTENPIF
jgi:hypothetical protein